MALILPSKATGAFSHLYDTFSATAPTIVTIRCADNSEKPNQFKTIRGILCSDLKFNITAAWANAMGVSVASVGSQAIDATDALTQFTMGISIRQPWMNRKIYQTTNPISFNVTVRFVADKDALNEVYKPVVALMSLLYPRFSGSLDGKSDTAGILSAYIIPGPTLFYNGKNTNANSNQGDVVSITIGNMVSYSMCYLEQLDVTFPNVWNADGMPHYAEATLKVTVMDSLYRKKDGSFTPFQDVPYDPALMNSIKAFAEMLGKGVESGVKFVGKFLSGG